MTDKHQSGDGCMHLKDVVLSVACSIKHTYLENRILKICDKFFLRNIKDIRGASKDAKPRNIKQKQDVNTKPTRGATLCTFDGIRTRGGSQLVKLIRAQGGCLGTKSR